MLRYDDRYAIKLYEYICPRFSYIISDISKINKKENKGYMSNNI